VPFNADPGIKLAPTSLPLHLELLKHSPSGFAWGYGGSGPAQLALALLVEATNDPALALRHYQEFKFYAASGVKLVIPHPVLCRIGVRYAFEAFSLDGLWCGIKIGEINSHYSFVRFAIKHVAFCCHKCSTAAGRELSVRTPLLC
jgi:hypothetical protein